MQSVVFGYAVLKLSDCQNIRLVEEIKCITKHLVMGLSILLIICVVNPL